MLFNQIVYRLGRAMYMQAAGDIPNDMRSNGELMLQKAVVTAYQHKSLHSEELIIFDVGANVGDWSLGLLKLLDDKEIDEQIRLFAFEPVPDTLATFRSNLPKSAVLHIEELAFSSKQGIADIYVSSESNAGTNSLCPASEELNRKKAVSIRIDTVAAYCLANNIPSIALLKCDTEGHDFEVIRGAMPMFYKNEIKIFQFEYNHRWIYAGNFLRDVFMLFENLPYRLGKLQKNCILLFDDWHPELEKFIESNYVIIHKDAIRYVPVRYGWFDTTNSLVVDSSK
jgi:FkbM family methyltransferase